MVFRIILIAACSLCCMIVACTNQTTEQSKPSGSTGDTPTPGSPTESKQRQPLDVDERKHSIESTVIPDELLNLFHHLDQLGRSKISDARFIELVFDGYSKNAWLLDENDEVVTVLRDDLLPWTYSKNSELLFPSSWHPNKSRLESLNEKDFESYCKELSQPEKQVDDDFKRMRRIQHEPGPSHRLLVAHAAWKQGLGKYCEPILSQQPEYLKGPAEFREAVLEDLAWLHLLRGVNLLMYADRRDVVTHLQLILKISSKGKYSDQATDLLKHLKRLIVEENKSQKEPPPKVDLTNLTDTQKAEYYVSQLKDVWAMQVAQPGHIDIYAAIDGRQLQNLTQESNPEVFANPPTVRLKKLGEKAFPLS